MFVKNIYARHFRNFDEMLIELSNRKNLILGRNGMGKTNILEAIYILGYAKSFRSSQERDVVMWGKDGYILRGDFKKGYEDIEVEVIFTRNGKTVRINGERLKSISHLVGVILCVYMGFNDIDIVSGPPLYRRRFLDQSISTIDPLYMDNLKKYIYCLGQRNSLLQNGYNDTGHLEIWNDKLVEYGSYLIAKRIEYIKYLNENIRNLVDKKIVISYQTTVYPEFKNGLITRDVLEDSIFYIKKSYNNELKKNIDQEKKLGFTFIGPHRDDFDITMDGIKTRLFASLGQMRSLAIILRILQAGYYEYKSQEKPILLVDDVFLELDSNVSARISDIMRSESQIIVTTTEFQNVPPRIKWDRIIEFDREGKPVWN